jgi:hypothetical protein
MALGNMRAGRSFLANVHYRLKADIADYPSPFQKKLVQFDMLGTAQLIRKGVSNETCFVVPSSTDRFAGTREVEAAVRIVALLGLVRKSARLRWW